MPRPLPSTFANVYATVAQTLLKELGDSLAVEAGPPTTVDVVPITEPVRAKAWNEPHPEATDQAMRELAEQRYAEHTQSGMDDEKARQAVAEDLTHFRYRARMPLYTSGTVSWAEQVREATRLSRAAQRQPVPPPPLPPAQLPGLPRDPMKVRASLDQTFMGTPPGPPPVMASPPSPGVPPGMPSGMPPGVPSGMSPPGMPPGAPGDMPPNLPPQGMPPGMPPILPRGRGPVVGIPGG